MKLVIDLKNLNLIDLMDDIMNIIEERYEKNLDIFPLLKLYQMLSKGKALTEGTVNITVHSGLVTDVEPLPPGWDYNINDLDAVEEDVPASEEEIKSLPKVGDNSKNYSHGLCLQCKHRNTCIGPVGESKACPGDVPISMIPDDSKDGDLNRYEAGDPQ